MRSNGKGIKVDDIDYTSYIMLGKFIYDIRVTMKNGKEIKLKRRIGKSLLKALEE